jgi:hypothetical protein
LSAFGSPPAVKLDCASSDRYFKRILGAYGLAAKRSGEVTHQLAVGSQVLRVSFASSELGHVLVGPLKRLLAPALGAPLASIFTWDSASSGVQVPRFPFPGSAVGAGGAVDGFNDARFRAVYQDDGSGFHAVSLFDYGRRLGLVWFADYARIHWYEQAEPLRAAIHWALTNERRALLHASAVADARGAVLLAGSGGVGKTTTTLASIQTGLNFVGDNYVLLSLDDEPTVYGLYGTAKLWPEAANRLPHVESLVRTVNVRQGEKIVLDVARHWPCQIATGLPIRAVVIPEITGSDTARVVPCSRGEALLALAPTTVLQLPRETTGLAAMAQLLRRVPTYKLKLADDVMRGPLALSQLLGALGS